MRAHSGPDEGDLRDALISEEIGESNALLDGSERLCRLAHRALGAGEGDVGQTRRCGRDVLHDHVDVDAGIGEGTEDCRGLAGTVRYADDRDLGVIGVCGCTGDDRLLHGVSRGDSGRDRGLGQDKGALAVGEGRPHVDGQIEAARIFNATQVEHLGAGRGQLQHLLVGDDVELTCLGHDSRVGAKDTVDIGVDLAHVGAERRGQCDRRRVGAAPTQGGDVLGVLRDALEAGNDRDRTRGECLLDTAGSHVDDASGTMRGVGDESRLRSGVGASLLAQVVDGHGDQRHGDALARSEEHVELPAGWLG